MQKLILIDGNSLFFRAYYATAYTGGELMKNKQGVYTNALFGFINMVDKILQQPYSHVLVAFDTKEKTKRHEAFDDYKAGRPPMPQEMAQQIPLIHQYLKELNIKDESLAGYEADDIIGTLSKEAADLGYEVAVYSSDRDLLQLINDKVTIHLLKKGVTDIEDLTPKTFFEKYGLHHSQMIDLKALMGDPSDNIPGVPGVGEKTAVKLLQQYETLENILQNKDQISGKLGERIRENEDKAILSKMLATIDLNVPLDFNFHDLERKQMNYEGLVNFYNEMDLHVFIKKLNKPVETKDDFITKIITDHDQFSTILKPNMAIHIELADFNYHTSDIIGFGLSDGETNYFIPKDIGLASIDFQLYLSDPSIPKLTYDQKAFRTALKWLGYDLQGVTFDLLLSSYLIHQKIAKEDFKVICMAFDYEDIEYDELIYGKGAKKGLPELSIYSRHVAKKAKAIFSLQPLLIEKLKTLELYDLFTNIEMPLAIVLSDMEYSGISVDQNELKQQKTNLKNRIDTLEHQIYESVGKKFNIGSPKQLAEILFVDLGLDPSKKTKTKNLSTNVDVLNTLIDKHPVIPMILDYRQLTKLYSTYIEGIEQSIFADGKVHTIFAQALTATGRLSSLEPNLQNIPIRTEEGRQIRKLFVPSKPNHYFVSADYSQIELRVLADMANVAGLIDAFNKKEDIHTRTAKEVFGSETVTPEERRKAKAVNFGIIYGIGAWSLAEDIHTTPRDAQAFIDKYLSIYPEIKTYMEQTVDNAVKQGYVKTILNRRRYIGELESPIYAVREFGKRTAMNAPIQGSAADIIKKAMIDLHAYIYKNKKKSRILLQVHDELVLEVPESELVEMQKVVPEIMSKAIHLKVALESSCDTGKNWYELK
ncbi:DNA polymerase I [Acholeplasma vituli]|uniref:DNA polymerase I n=1 Tax=Paracholeplasma vituli TaxID=69473 RepID=A0ABT2PYM7_9MOLU|nr:DNA polymerase I [Paracholeplasma vituli]MCU0104768.1 DNA polymerase I [Paracholeplasma vituli]